MSPDDLTKLRELTLLLDLAYQHHYANDPEAARHYKSADGSVRLEFGNLWYRQNHPVTGKNSPCIEAVVVYSSVFSASRVSYFDSLDEAVDVVGEWYAQAKESSGL